jgi:AAA15 family ATPase/GTPase
MKLCKLYIPDYQQFKNFELDLTHPQTGAPLEKICLIGPNGTGKSTLLELMIRFIKEPHMRFLDKGAVEIEFQKERILCLASQIGWKIPLKNGSTHSLSGAYIYLKAKATQESEWQADLFNQPSFEEYTQDPKKVSQSAEYKYLMQKYAEYIDPDSFATTYQNLYLQDHSVSQSSLSPDLLVYARSESQHNPFLDLKDVPVASVDQALELLNTFPYYHEVSPETSSDFWKTLIYHLKLREKRREEYERQPDNLEKTKRQLIEEFDSQHPDILKKLGQLWNEILAQAGLELDLEHISQPVQLNDNLKAYIRLKATGEAIPYHKLSTGIRNFLFRLGHIYSLFFEREIERGFLFVDEPENSLFPDLLLNLPQRYRDLTQDKSGKQNTQLFMATHHPLIAAQFEPYERFILNWKEDGSVSVHRGVTPIGDDPNDVLQKDFELVNLLGPEGQKKFSEYLHLRQTLRQTQDQTEKDTLLKDIIAIGNAYGF